MKQDDFRPRAFKLTALVCALFLASGICAFARVEQPKAAADEKAKAAGDEKPRGAADEKAKAAGDEKPKTAGAEKPQPAADAKAEAGGQLTIEKSVVDVGDVVRGQLATAVFEVRNTGAEVLKILKATPG